MKRCMRQLLIWLVLVSVLFTSSMVRADSLPFPWTPLSVAGAELTVFPAYLDGLKQDSYSLSPGAPVVTPVVATNGTAVQTIVAPNNGHVIGVNSGVTGSNVTWQADASAGRNGFLRMGNGAKSWLQVYNSLGAFRFFHSTQVYTIAFWIRFPAGATYGAGTNFCILDSLSQSGGVAGISLYRYSDNKLYFLSCNGSGTGSQYMTGTTFKSATTLGASGDNTWHFVAITAAGSGGLCSIYIDGTWNGTTYPTPSATTTLTAGAAIGTNSTNNLQIGLGANGSFQGTFDIDCLTIASTVLSPADLANLYNFNPTVTTNSLLRVKTTAAKLAPTDISHAWAWHDFSTAADPSSGQPLLYTAATYPPSASNGITATAASYQNVEYVENRLGANLMRYLYLPSQIGVTGYPLAPTWQPGYSSLSPSNGRFGAYFNGSWNATTMSSNPYALALSQITPTVNKTWYFILRQTSNGTAGAGQVGSHIHGASTSTVVYGWIGGTQHSDPDYFGTHLSPGAITNMPAQSCYTSLKLSSTTTPATAGTYLPVISQAQTQASYFCAATNYWIYIPLASGGSNWIISPTNNATTSTLTTAGTPFWETASANYSITQAFVAHNGASGTIGSPTGIPSGGPDSVNVYHGQQDDVLGTRVGVNGFWGPWVTNSPPGCHAWDSIGYDYHAMNTFLNANSLATQHFELNGYLYEAVVVLYSLPDHVFYGLMRGCQDRYGLNSYMYLGN